MIFVTVEQDWKKVDCEWSFAVMSLLFLWEAKKGSGYVFLFFYLFIYYFWGGAMYNVLVSPCTS